MVVDEMPREALDLERLRPELPSSIRVLNLKAEDYVDSTGEQTIRIRVVIDESTDIENISGEAVGELKAAIRASLRKHGVTVFPYFSLGKPSEWEEDHDEE